MLNAKCHHDRAWFNSPRPHIHTKKNQRRATALGDLRVRLSHGKETKRPLRDNPNFLLQEHPSREKRKNSDRKKKAFVHDLLGVLDKHHMIMSHDSVIEWDTKASMTRLLTISRASTRASKLFFRAPCGRPKHFFAEFRLIISQQADRILDAVFYILSHLKPPIWHVYSKKIGRSRLLPELEP